MVAEGLEGHCPALRRAVHGGAKPAGSPISLNHIQTAVVIEIGSAYCARIENDTRRDQRPRAVAGVDGAGSSTVDRIEVFPSTGVVHIAVTVEIAQRRAEVTAREQRGLAKSRNRRVEILDHQVLRVT
ncbi:hypothetical protein D9M68_883540 [compost metagenome]